MTDAELALLLEKYVISLLDIIENDRKAGTNRAQDLYLAAVCSTPCALKYIDKHLRSKELCWAAIESKYAFLIEHDLIPSDILTADYVRESTKKGASLYGVPRELITFEICTYAVRNYGSNCWNYIPEHFKTNELHELRIKIGDVTPGRALKAANDMLGCNTNYN
jgi:hypothetical protein